MGRFYFTKRIIFSLVFIATCGLLNAQTSWWTQVGSDIDADQAQTLAGNSVSLSSDGKTLAVGAYGYDGANTNSGRVRVYKNISGIWTPLGGPMDGLNTEDALGRVVSLNADGTVVAMGAPGDPTNGIGFARVFAFNGTNWVQRGSDIVGANVGDNLGQSVSLSSDGNYLAVGIDKHDIGAFLNVGKVQVYQFSGGSWIPYGSPLTGVVAGELFGRTVSLSGDALVLAVGAPGVWTGSAKIYEFSGGDWVEKSQFNGINSGDQFGYWVSTSRDGSTVAVAAPQYSSVTGMVRLYKKSAGTWAQIGADLVGETVGDRSGRQSVALNSNGTIVAIGAMYNDGNGIDAGHTRVYQYQTNAWVQLSTDIEGEASNDYSGYAVSLSGDGAVVATGAIQNQGAGLNAGHVRVYAYGNCTTGTESIPPTAVCKDIVIYLDNDGQASFSPSELDGGSTDNCEIKYFTANRTLFSCDDIGTANVVLTAHDKSGNTATCNATVTISDLVSPTAVCKDIVVSLDNGVSASITAASIDGGSKDNCGIIDKKISKSSFTLADLGENSVTLTVYDAAGYVSSCTSVVTVGDTMAPKVKCNPLDVILDSKGQYELTATDIAAISAGTTDNLDAYSNLVFTVTPDSFGCAEIGSQMVELKATDTSGNTSKCEATVTVMDTVTLKLNKVEDIMVELEPGICETKVTYPEIMANSACATVSKVEGLGAGGMFPIGTTTEKWMAVNGSLDTVYTSFKVVVTAKNAKPTIDNIAGVEVLEDTKPVDVKLAGITFGNDCKPQVITVKAAAKNTNLVTAVAVNYKSPDATGTLQLTIAPKMFGTDTVTVTVSDGTLSVAKKFAVKVTHVNHAPVVANAVANKTVNASYVLKVPVVSDKPVFKDPDGDKLTYEIMVQGKDKLPTWLKLQKDTIIASPMIADTACMNIIVKAKDVEGLAVADTFQLCVKGYPTAVFDMEISALKVQMYPNPSKGEVTLKIDSSDLTDSEVIVRSITGSEVLRKKFRSTELIKLDLTEQVTGIYLVTVKQLDKSVVKKLILDRK